MSQRRFSQNGQQALVRAYQAAREMGHAVIEPEHLLLGVLGEESALLKEWNGLEKQAAAEIFRRLGKGEKTPSALSPRSAAVIEQAAALSSPGSTVTARNLLCALLQ